MSTEEKTTVSVNERDNIVVEVSHPLIHAVTEYTRGGSVVAYRATPGPGLNEPGFSMKPGAMLAWSIHKITHGKIAACDRCAELMTLMDNKGWVWCIANILMIRTRMEDNARRQGFDANAVWALFHHTGLDAYAKKESD